ncbi:MAG: hypothetical protein ACFCUT_07410 [Kiloniellaceae bacterium]
MLVGAIAVITALQAGPAVAQSGELAQSGTVTVSQTQIAFIGSGNFGGGELAFEGKTYSFTIGGLGLGGFGVSKIEAQGEVYNLTSLNDFEGAYGQARTGIVVGDRSAGQLWLENASGVYIHLITERKGLALSLGGDAVYISID